ncbi:MAG: peptidase domain-containing ABC transporter [Leptolyngbyaceae cyanobacterium bins.59]|nr:peptidase domain-containing ABC transporter [Leptolyngbyaceae cyanobacterium bins.59]
MTSLKPSIQEFLKNHDIFGRLPSEVLVNLVKQIQSLRYRMGQKILDRERLPGQVVILLEGQARLLGYAPQSQLPTTLSLLNPGALIGAIGVLRGVACETAIASNEAICLTLPSQEFLKLVEQYPDFATAVRDSCHPAEIFELLSGQLNQQARAGVDPKGLAQQLQPKTVVRYIPPGGTPVNHLEADRVWVVSGGGIITNFPIGSRIPTDGNGVLQVPGFKPARLLGFPESEWLVEPAQAVEAEVLPSPQQLEAMGADIPYASEQIPEFVPDDRQRERRERKASYPFVRGTGMREGTLACFQMLSRHLRLPFRREVIRRVIDNQIVRTGSVSLQACGAIGELMGLTAQLVEVPGAAFTRIPTPALIEWNDGIALVYEVSDREVTLAVPNTGLIHLRPGELLSRLGAQAERLPVLLLKATKETPQQKFGLSWFLPAIAEHRRVLLEVLLASFFVQLFGLANPLMIQVIIDKVLVQNSIDTLQILGVFLLVVAVFEAVLSSLRTYLFAETTNRIDMALGSEIIDHLLRLPLRYFERRPVGELSTRINELENIRQFMTGTALTVVLDSIFSVVYIVVMFIYSWVLTLVALSTIPLFAFLTIIATPILRRQLREKAERNAETQSHLVEVLSGIQTVKAQNIELRSRWEWQERYARYVSAGFKTVLTSTAAGSASNFLNQLSGLLVLWVGAYLVLKGSLTLGQLIAFRIIAGYVTSPLLRLVQLWQNFQETALSLERLSDIVDTPQEMDAADRQNIPMPSIQGRVTYDSVSFRFAASGPMQLNNISMDFPAGTFIGIVGQSGSGKSTLTKLLARLYEPNGGRILIDDYDISKVELYSLRSQIGMVPQETLLFDGTVQENIALTVPDASSEEIIEAAKLAVAHEFIMGLPAGYNTRVGERGAGLSGGQRQRIAIARTILQNPQLLILDEATSALDYDTERQVCLNLTQAFRDRTVLFITHRLATIQQADIILVMDKGNIVEQGTHAELMALKGRYYCLYHQQASQLS